MTITEIRVGASRTINLGNFESLRIEASVAIALAEGDDPAKAKAAVQPELRQLLEETYRAQHKPKAPANPPESGFKAPAAEPEY